MKDIAASAAFLGFTNPVRFFGAFRAPFETTLVVSGDGDGEHCVRIAFASSFFVLFQRLAALSLALRFFWIVFLCSFLSLFCVHSFRFLSSVQNAIIVGLFFFH